MLNENKELMNQNSPNDMPGTPEKTEHPEIFPVPEHPDISHPHSPNVYPQRLDPEISPQQPSREIYPNQPSREIHPFETPEVLPLDVPFED
jgi:hypothetical protein